MQLRTWAALGLAALASACASSYGPNLLTGGYNDTRIDDTHYRVRFDGNGYTSEDRVWNFWIHRCAELTASKGYTYFTLERPAGKGAAAAPDVPPTPPVAQAGAMRPAVYREGEGGGFTKTKGTTYVPIYIPGGPGPKTWHTDAVVYMLNDPLLDDLPVLRASAILEDLGPYVKSDGKSTPMARDSLLRRAMVVNGPRPDHSMTGTL